MPPKRILLINIYSFVTAITQHPHANRFPFTLKYIEALLKKETDFEVKLIDYQVNYLTIDKLVDLTISWNAGIVVIYSITPACSEVLGYAHRIKNLKKNIIIINIGQGISFCPEKYLFPGSPIDIGVVGEPELKVYSIIKDLKNGKQIEDIKNIFCQHNYSFITDLDMLPFPGYDNDEIEKYNHIYPVRVKKRLYWGHILTSRGCPHDCVFCSQVIRESYGRNVRLRKATNVVDEIEYLLKKNINIICFSDDNFTYSKEHVLGICDEIIKRNIKVHWVSHARIDNVTPNLLAKMREAGCILLRFGIETGSARILRILKKTGSCDWKERARDVFGACRKNKIDTVALFLIGNPTETKEEMYESIRFAQALTPDIIQLSFFTPYPGSKIYEEIKDRITESDIIHLYHYDAPAINLSRVSTKEIKKIYKEFYKSFLLKPTFIMRHIMKYGGFYMHNPKVFIKLFKIIEYFMMRRKNAGLSKAYH